jgi:hypothetical protein
VSLDGAQVGDVAVGDVAAGDVHKSTTNNYLADLPPGLAQWAADQQDVTLRMIDALDALRNRVDHIVGHLREDIDLYRALDANERTARRGESDRMTRRIVGALVGLAVAMMIGAVLLGWLIVDKAGALVMARILAGAAGALAVEAARHR